MCDVKKIREAINRLAVGDIEIDDFVTLMEEAEKAPAAAQDRASVVQQVWSEAQAVGQRIRSL